MNVKPAPFDLAGSAVIGAAVQGLPTRSRRLLNVPILPIKLVDQVRGMDPADVPGLLRPDCSPPDSIAAFPVVVPSSPPVEGAGPTEPARFAPLQATPSVPAEAPPALGRPDTFSATPERRPERPGKIPLPPLSSARTMPRADGRAAPRFTLPQTPSEARRVALDGAIAFLKARCILVTVVDRNDPIRRYRVSGYREPLFASDVVALAASQGCGDHA